MQPSLHKAERPLVLFANALGDHLLTLPALRALAQLFPGRLRLLGLSENLGPFFQDIPLHSVVPLTVTKVLPGHGIEFDVERAAEAIGDCDCFMSLVPWHTASVDKLLGRLSTPRTVGFFDGFSTVLPLDYGKHSSDMAFDLPRHFDPSLSIQDFSQPPKAPPLERIRALTKGYRILVVHADTQPVKMWKWQSFEAVLRRFFAAHNDFLGLLIGLTNAAVDPAPLAGSLIPCLDLPIPDTLAMIEMADLYIGVDSCFLHAADLYRVPGVGLFGPTSEKEFGFRFGPHRHIRGNGSMMEIAEDGVLSALNELACSL